MKSNTIPPKKITELIERFENNIDAYKRGQYNEAQVRLEFIDLSLETRRYLEARRF